MKKNLSSTHISLGTKAETLKKLRPLLKTAVITPIVIFTVAEWGKNKVSILKQLKDEFGSQLLVVRSSAKTEDTLEQSNAGHFTSVLKVSTKNNKKLIHAINSVIASYNDKRTDHQVLVQPMVTSVELCGVVFTRDIDTHAPYITFNYDDISGNTDSITSGKGSGYKALTLYRGKEKLIKDHRILLIYKTIMEIEGIIGNEALDIEFAYKNNITYIFQVRYLPTKSSSEYISKEQEKLISETLKQIYLKIKELKKPHPYLFGKETLYGIMPDWNPAEMIGIKPRPLALSLYKELITDTIWAYQRDNYGYKNLRSFPLLISLAGHPYIDVRVDFNSFIPQSLYKKLSHKLADFYIQKLKRIPASHDKVEFDIVYSCYTLDLDNRLQELEKYGFTDDELFFIKLSLLNLTNNIIKTEGLYKQDLKKINYLERKIETISMSSLPKIDKIYWLIEDCKRYGTLPFAGVARAAFIAVQFLNSMVNLNIITPKEKKRFMGSLNTVAKQLSNDMVALSLGKLTLKKFIKIYGHLRPGTYDILSESYAENPYRYFDFKRLKKRKKIKPDNFSFSRNQLKKIEELLQRHGIEASINDFLIFLRESIEGREYAKFIFTKSLNQILTYIKQFGEKHALSSDDMSFTEITTLMKLYSSIALYHEKNFIQDEIHRNKKIYENYTFIKLPNLICKPEDIYHFYQSTIDPNYVTLERIIGEPTVLESKQKKLLNIRRKVAFIESADPGFDWIFSHDIAGLITMYGGVNSHMAIRAAELNIPAVIGCGPVLFKQWSKVQSLEIDCLNKQVTILS